MKAHRIRVASFVHGSLRVFALQVSGAGLLYVLHVVFARSMPPSEYGSLAYALGWAGVLGGILTLGLPGTVLRFLSRYAHRGEVRSLQRFWRWTLKILKRQSVALGAVSSAVSIVVFFLFGPQAALMTALTLVLAFTLAITETAISTGRSLEQVTLAYAPPLIARPLLILASLALMATTEVRLEASSILLVYAGMAALVCSLQFVKLSGTAKSLGTGSGTIEQTRSRHSKDWRAVARTLWLFSALGVLMRRVTLLILGALSPAEQVASYEVAWKTASIVGFVLLSVNAVIAPKFSSLHAAGNRDGLQALLKSAIHWIVWPTVLGVAVIVLLRTFLLGLFGTSYVDAQDVLVVLVAGQAVHAMTGSVGYLLNTTGHQVVATKIYSGCLFLNVLVAFLVIPLFGALGAAIAGTFAMVVWNLACLMVVKKRLGVDPSVMQLVRSR